MTPLWAFLSRKNPRQPGGFSIGGEPLKLGWPPIDFTEGPRDSFEISNGSGSLQLEEFPLGLVIFVQRETKRFGKPLDRPDHPKAGESILRGFELWSSGFPTAVGGSAKAFCCDFRNSKRTLEAANKNIRPEGEARGVQEWRSGAWFRGMSETFCAKWKVFEICFRGGRSCTPNTCCFQGMAAHMSSLQRMVSTMV